MIWELSYIVFVWPRLTRPIVIMLAFPLHMGIAFGMGMITFGYIMIVANLAFVAPWLTRRLIDGLLFQHMEQPSADVESAQELAIHSRAG